MRRTSANMIRNWAVPVGVTLLFLGLAKGAIAALVEGQLVLDETTVPEKVEVMVIDDGHDREIAYSDGTSTIQITDNEYDDLLPVYSDGKIAWQGQDENYLWQIFVYDIATGVTTRLTHDRFPSEYVQAASGVFTWEMPKGIGSDIFYFNGRDVIRVTGSTAINELPVTDGTYIAWEHFDGEDKEIMALKVATEEITQLTDDSINQSQLALYKGEIFYKEFDGEDNEIFGLAIASGARRQITNNKVDDGKARVAGNVLFWQTPAADVVALQDKPVPAVEKSLSLESVEPSPTLAPSTTPSSITTPDESPVPDASPIPSPSPLPSVEPPPTITPEPSLDLPVSPLPSVEATSPPDPASSPTPDPT